MQKSYLRDFTAFQRVWEEQHTPRQAGPDAQELWNRFNNGAKATALTYTMNLKDYHKLFIGRSPSAGNESEVREITQRMCDQLHTLYPLIILTREEYKGMINGTKYRS